MQEFLELVGMIREEIPLSSLIALGVWIVSALVQARLLAGNKIYNRGRRKMQKAEQRGHAVDAVLEQVLTQYRDGGTSTSNLSYNGRYIYTVNGKQYSKTIYSNHKDHRNVIRLYYFGSPKRAKTAGELTYWDRRILPMIVPLLLAVLTILLLNGGNINN